MTRTLTPGTDRLRIRVDDEWNPETEHLRKLMVRLGSYLDDAILCLKEYRAVVSPSWAADARRAVNAAKAAQRCGESQHEQLTTTCPTCGHTHEPCGACAGAVHCGGPRGAAECAHNCGGPIGPGDTLDRPPPCRVGH